MKKENLIYLTQISKMAFDSVKASVKKKEIHWRGQDIPEISQENFTQNLNLINGKINDFSILDPTGYIKKMH